MSHHHLNDVADSSGVAVERRRHRLCLRGHRRRLQRRGGKDGAKALGQLDISPTTLKNTLDNLPYHHHFV
jgi:hypothetical protein